jgi:hypothetical protein
LWAEARVVCRSAMGGDDHDREWYTGVVADVRQSGLRFVNR